MPKKKAAAKAKTEPTMDTNPTPSTDTREPGEINRALASPRMQKLLEDHRRMGARPPKAK